MPWEAWEALVIALLLGALAGWSLYRWQMRRLRRPIESIMQSLSGINLEASELLLNRVDTPLLKQLTEKLSIILQQMQREYQAQKQFTQDASHELQTPLAVIKAHIELLLQSPQLGQLEAEALGGVLQNVNRLSRLNSALILLSKIDNQRFPDVQAVRIGALLQEILENFEDLISAQKLRVELLLSSEVQVSMSASLAEILLANLLQNAIRHNLRGGYISASLKGQRLTVTNPGKVLTGPPEKLFERFERDSDSEQSLGLGLSIVQRICKLYGFGLQYHHEEGLHTVSIDFSKRDAANTA